MKFLKILSSNLFIFILLLGLFELINAKVQFVKVPSEPEAYYRGRLNWPTTLVPYQKDFLNGLYVPHPLFIYVNNPELPHVNNYGFFSTKEYPYKKAAKKEIVIGLYGASVAEQIYTILELEMNSSADFEKLKRCGYNFTLLNLAMGSSKEPQAYQIYVHTKEWADFYIKLDGRNDVMVDGSRKYPVEFPFMTSSLMDLSPEKLKHLNRFYDYRKAEYALADFAIKHSELHKSAIFYHLYEMARTYISEQIDDENLQVQSINRKYADGTDFYENRENKQLEVWGKYTQLQFEQSKRDGKYTFNFLQPSQYLEKLLPLEENELKKIMVENEMLADHFREMNKRLSKYALDQQEQFTSVDLSTMFINEKVNVFKDNCCHLTTDGYRQLSKAMIKVIAPKVLAKYKCQ